MLRRFLLSIAARILSKRAHQTQREKVHAKARAMREALGLPESGALNG